MMRIAIIGAGIGGLTLAHALRERAAVTVFEKARGVGGRMATRRERPFAFDHGAGSFTVRTEAFAAWLAPLRAAGVVAEWSGTVVTLAGGQVLGPRLEHETRFVGVPGMNALAAHLAQGVDVRTGIDVAPLAAGAAPYALESVTGEALGTFDLVVSTAPTHQSELLFRAAADGAPLPTARMKPRHALMVAWDRPWDAPWIAARVQDGPLRWIAIDSTKPGRASEVTALVAHTRSPWSRQHDGTPAEELAPILLAHLRAALPVDIGGPMVVRAHRWRSALVKGGARPGPWLAAGGTLAATGDWASASRVEEVCLSALDLAARIGAVAS